MELDTSVAAVEESHSILQPHYSHCCRVLALGSGCGEGPLQVCKEGHRVLVFSLPGEFAGPTQHNLLCLLGKIVTRVVRVMSVLSGWYLLFHWQLLHPHACYKPVCGLLVCIKFWLCKT